METVGSVRIKYLLQKQMMSLFTSLEAIIGQSVIWHVQDLYQTRELETERTDVFVTTVKETDFEVSN